MHSTDILDDFEFDPHLYLSGDEEGEVVAKYYSAMEADVAAARLRTEGIPCFLANSFGQSVMPQLQTIVRLHTRIEDAEKARAILAETATETQDGISESRNLTTITLIVLGIMLGLALAGILVQRL